MPPLQSSRSFQNWQQSTSRLSESGEVAHTEREKATQRSPEDTQPNAVQRVRVILPQAATATLAVIAILAVMTYAKAITMPITMAVMLYFVMRPIITKLTKWGLPTGVSATLTLGLIGGILAVGAWYLTGPIKDWITNAPLYLDEIEAKLSGVEEQIKDMSEASDKIKEIAAPDDEGEPVQVAIQQPQLFPGIEIISNSGGLVAGTIVTLGLLFFLLAYGQRMIENLVSIFKDASSRANALHLIDDLQHGLSLYFFTVTLINFGLGVVTGLAMFLLGLPNPIMIGTMAFLFNFIPFLGAWTGTAIVFLLAVLEFDTIGYASLAPIIYFSLTSLEGQFVTPWILGRSMSMNPLLVFLSLAVWGWMWGIGGVFLAVPLLAVLKIVSDYFPSMNIVSQAMKT